MHRLRALALALALLAPVLCARGGGARAESPDAPADTDVGRRLERLETENEGLKRRVEELEKAAAPATPAAPAEKSAPAASETGADPAARSEVELGRGEGFGVEVRYGDVILSPKLFADVGFAYREPPLDDGLGQTAFFLGELDLFATAAIGERIQALSETVFETDVGDEEDEEDEDFRIEVERLWVQYAVAPWLRLKLGREHDALTYWNRRFHHGAWIQTTLSRPRIVQFEEDDGLLPIDVTGIEANGQIALPIGTVEYVLALYNGRGRRPEDVQSASDRNSHKAVSGHLRLSPALRPSLWVGSSFYHDEIPEDERRPERDDSIREWIVGAFIVDRIGPAEVAGEMIFIQHRDHTSDEVFHSFGSYIQVAFPIDDLTPYARFEYVDIDRSDPYYAPRVGDTTRGIVGLRWDLADSVAVKAEYGYALEEESRAGSGKEDVHRCALQVALVF